MNRNTLTLTSIGAAVAIAAVFGIIGCASVDPNAAISDAAAIAQIAASAQTASSAAAVAPITPDVYVPPAPPTPTPATAPGCVSNACLVTTPVCVGDACEAAQAAPKVVRPTVPVVDIRCTWPNDLTDAKLTSDRVVAVVWNPGCGWCRREMPAFNASADALRAAGYSLAGVLARSADGQDLLMQTRLLEFPCLVVLKKDAAGKWTARGCAYRAAAPTTAGVLAAVADLAK